MPLVTFYPRRRGIGAYGGYGMQGQVNVMKAQAKTALYAQALQHEKQLGSLKLQALGKIYDSKLENVDLKAQLKYRPQVGAYGGYGGYGIPPYGVPAYGAPGYAAPYMSAVSGASGLGGMFSGMSLGGFGLGGLSSWF